MRLIQILVFALCVSPQDPSAENEILSLGEKLLAQAKAQYEKKEWFDAIELAERARTAFLALSELYASQNRAADVRKLNDSVTQCNQFIRLARDGRKAELEKAAPAPVPDLVPKPPEKPGPPERGAQEKALKSVREVFKADYAKTTPADRQALARKLLQEAMATTSERSAQYVLLREAADLAAQAGDIATAFSAVDAIDTTFDVDALAFRLAALSRLPATATHEIAGPAVEACLIVALEGIRRDHFDLASLALKKAEALARNPVNVTLQARVQERVRDLAEVRKEREVLRVAEKTLLGKPEDSAANLQSGRFWCYLKSDWAKGLPFLRRGADPGLKKIVETEIANPSGPELMMDLADAWWRVAEAEGNPLAKSNLKAHARAWYEQALPGLAGFPRTRVEKLLRSLDEEDASRWAVNLLKLVDVKKDSVQGAWRLEDGVLFSPREKGPVRLQIPYAPPEEYDLKLRVAKKGPHNMLKIGLLGGHRQFSMDIDGWEGADRGGLSWLDGKNSNANETSFKLKVFPNQEPRIITYSVRKSGVTLSVDQRNLVDWKGEFRRLGLADHWAVPSKRALLLGAWDSEYEFREIWLTPVSGQGQKLR